MPKPAEYETEKDWMAACVPMRVEEGDKQDQAVAVCMSMWREKKAKLNSYTYNWNQEERGDEMSDEQERAMSLWQIVKGFFVKEKPVEETKNIHPFMVWKEEGSYRWLAVYSNKWRDSDNPPEILAEAAHKEFVNAVDEGDWTYPEVWLWHVGGTRFGVANIVAYDDSGFALASGTVDKGREDVAEALSKMDNLATSHGMPAKEIQRDGTDPSIITRYRTMEISPLPFEAAANRHGTGFQILQVKEVDEMALPTKKRSFLEETLGTEGVAALEQMLQGKAEELEKQGVEFKEETVDESVEEAEVPQAEEISEEVQEPEEITEPKEAELTYVTADELVQAFEQYIKPIVDQMSGMAAGIETQNETIKELQAALKDLQKDDETKLKAALDETPAASLFARIGSVIGSDETYVDGRTSLAKSGPEQTKDANGPTPVGILNEFMAQSYGG